MKTIQGNYDTQFGERKGERWPDAALHNRQNSMTNPNSENTNEGHSLDRLVGRLGWLKTKGENVRVKIIAVNHDKPCHKCGGPWGTVETQGHAMVGSGMMSLAGTTAEGCLNDVKLDDDTAGTPNEKLSDCP